MYAEEIDRVI